MTTPNTHHSTVLVHPILADRDAYESGRKLGQMTAYLIVAVVVLWLIVRMFRKD